MTKNFLTLREVSCIRSVRGGCERASCHRPGDLKSQKETSHDGAKVFTATKAKDRDELGEVLTRWIHDNPKARIIDKVVTQSSDREFHCLSITIFYEMQQ